VTLSGEAEFEVNPSTRAPFVVRTGAITTQVLGTIFSVRHYVSDTDVQVAVSSGKVVSQNASTPVVVSANTIAHVTDSTATVTSQDDAGSYSNYAQGKLIFHHVPIATMLVTIGRWYGMQFQLADTALGAQPVSTAFTVSDSKTMLVQLKDLLNVTARFDGDVVILHPRQDTYRSMRGDTVFTSSREIGR